jgi:peptide/nickel transport system permease protein
MQPPLDAEVLSSELPDIEAPHGALPEAVVEGRSPYQLAWLRLRRDRVAMISAVAIVFVVLLALFAPLIAHLTGHGVNQEFHRIGETPDGAPKGPNHIFWLGTDDQGRDLLVRAAYGARVSLLAGLVASAVAVVVGTVVGLSAGYLGRFVDTVLSRIMDIVLALPYLLFAIALVAVVGPSLKIAIAVISFFSWASVARIVRGQVLTLREREFVEAARSLGASSRRIMFIDVLPNVLAQVVVLASLLIPSAIVFEATLSFLGLGVPPPTPSWGNMISGAETYYEAWWFLLVPSVLLLITTLAFNLFGDAVRDAFDPRGEMLGNRGKG